MHLFEAGDSPCALVTLRVRKQIKRSSVPGYNVPTKRSIKCSHARHHGSWQIIARNTSGWWSQPSVIGPKTSLSKTRRSGPSSY